MPITKIKNFLFYLIGFMLACYIHATPFIIAAYTVLWLAEGNLKNKFSAFFHNGYALLFISFYVLHLVGMLYTVNMASGWFNLQVKLSILIFPIMLVSEGEMNFGRQKLFTEFFAAGLVINGLICIIYAVWRYIALHKFIFQYMEFSLFLHPSYYSMYIDTALVFIFYILTEKSPEIKKTEKVYLYSAVFFLVFMLVLLQSKTGLLVSALIISIILVRYIAFTKRWITGIAILSGSALLSVVTYQFIITANRSRILSVENIIAAGKPMNTASVESTQARYFAWKSAWDAIKSAPLLGSGTGDAEDGLMKQYAIHNYTGIMLERLNTHNEYFQVTVALGIIGLISLLSCLLLPLYKSINEGRFVYLMLLIILLINFLTESMLETQGGTMFYGFFNSLLMFNFVI